jgi:hypothetical protein
LWDFVIAGLSFGLLIGGKGSGVFQAAALVGAWMAFTGRGLIRERGFRKFALLILVLIAASMLNGVYMYVRNWLVFGNPVHPYNVYIAGMQLFKGTMNYGYLSGPELLGKLHEIIENKSWLGRMYFTWSDPKSWINYGGRMGGFGPLFFTILLPAMLASTIIAFMQRRWRFLLALVLPTAALLTMYKLSWWSRYSIYYAAAGMLGFAYIDGTVLFSDMRRLLRYAALTMALISCFLFFQNRVPGLAALRHYLEKGPYYWHPSQFSTEGLHKNLFREVYPYLKPGTTIFIDHSFTYYETGTGGEFMCLWNLDFSNRIVYAGTQNRDEWFKTLEESGADFVLVGEKGDSLAWVERNPVSFRPLVKKGGFNFYRVRKPILEYHP